MDDNRPSAYSNLIITVPADVLVLNTPESKIHGANLGPNWGRQDPGGPHVGPMNFAIWDCRHCADYRVRYESESLLSAINQLNMFSLIPYQDEMSQNNMTLTAWFLEISTLKHPCIKDELIAALNINFKC